MTTVVGRLVQLGVSGERGEERIIEWANTRIADGNIAGDVASTRISGFSDPALRSGTFLLELLLSIAPESVSREQILEGATQQQRKLNAVYAISCAHKMGCTIFATWEDLVEVNPKVDGGHMPAHAPRAGHVLAHAARAADRRVVALGSPGFVSHLCR